MDIEKIIAEVLRRLETEIVSNAAGKRDDESKAKVLLISKERSRGHHLSEKINTLQAHYSIEYAEDTRLKDAHQIVIIADLDDSGLAKVTSGIFDEAYLAAMHEAMLKGKDILLNKDSLEIFRNKDTAPFAFFKFYINIFQDFCFLYFKRNIIYLNYFVHYITPTNHFHLYLKS